MILSAADYREKAREALNGNWPLAVGTGFVASLLGAYTAFGSSSGSSSSSSSDSSYDSLPEEMAIIFLSILAVIFVITLIWSLVIFVIGGPVSLGYAQFNLDLVDGNGPGFSDLFSQFHRFGTGFLMNFLRSLYILLWTLLFIFPGIVAAYKYAMTPYLLCDDPNMTASEAISESKRLMEGNKWSLFCLGFSFIGWDILCVFTFGIGNLWLRPYKEAAYAAFYREIKDAKYSTPVKPRPNVNYQSMPSWDGFDNL